jgi:hypothetical protein
MRARMKARPQLETLESMTLLSGAGGSGVMGMALALGGTEHGVFVAHRESSGKAYDVTTAGTVTPLGRAVITGNLIVASGISSGPPSGTLHLVTRKGSLTLQIPQSVAIPAGLPSPTSKNEIVDTYTITAGTGAYKGDTGSGVVELKFNGLASVRHRLQVGRAKITFTTLTITPPMT